MTRLKWSSLWAGCLLAVVGLTAAHPFLYMRGTRHGYGRNIRPLPCVSKGGETGVCMFAWDCMKANGTHLGTCIDRFYFGSCCKMAHARPPPGLNEIPSGGGSGGTKPMGVDASGQPSAENDGSSESQESPGDSDAASGSASTSGTGSTSGEAEGPALAAGTGSTAGAEGVGPTGGVETPASTGEVDGSTSTGTGAGSTEESGDASVSGAEGPASTTGTGEDGSTSGVESPASTTGFQDGENAGEVDTPSSTTGTQGAGPASGSESSTSTAGEGADSTSGPEAPASASGTEDSGSTSGVDSPASTDAEGTGSTGSSDDQGFDATPTTEVSVAVDPAPSQPDLPAGSQDSVDEDTTVAPGSGASSPDVTESQATSPSMGTAAPVSPPATESPTASEATIVIETEKPQTMTTTMLQAGSDTERPPTTEEAGAATVSITVSGDAEDGGEGTQKPTEVPALAAATLPPITSEEPVIIPVTTFAEVSTTKPEEPVSQPFFPVFPAAASEKPEEVTTLVPPPESGTEKPDEQVTLVFPSGPVATGKPSTLAPTTVDTTEPATTTSSSEEEEEMSEPTTPEPEEGDDSSEMPEINVEATSEATAPETTSKPAAETTVTPATAEATEKPEEPAVATMKPEEPAVATERPEEPVVTTMNPEEPAMATEKPEEPAMATEKPEEPSVATEKPEEPAVMTEKPEEPVVSTEKPEEPVETTVASGEGSVTTLAPTVTAEQELLERLNNSKAKDICGKPVYPTRRIVGGSEATFGEWPWQVSLRQWRQVTFLHKCGAALVNENWAITAAHCVENVQPEQLLLRLGEFDLERSDEPYAFAERKVQIIATHPQFDARTFEYDLALLRFYEPVNYQPNIIPICIPEDDYDFIGDTGFVTGWGRLYEDGPLPSVMQKVPVPVITNEECEAMYRVAGYVEHIPHIFICAGYEAGGKDSCEGDSGGPLVIQRDGVWNLAGVISWGIGCALPNQPGVYTRISEFREWIQKIVVF